MKVAVIGSRSFASWPAALASVRRFVMELPPDAVLITGGAVGVDKAAENAARERGWIPGEQLIILRPDYGAFPAATRRWEAPYARNRQMVDAADLVVAFHDGESGGTMQAVEYAYEQGKPPLVKTARHENRQRGRAS